MNAHSRPSMPQAVTDIWSGKSNHFNEILIWRSLRSQSCVLHDWKNLFASHYIVDDRKQRLSFVVRWCGFGTLSGDGLCNLPAAFKNNLSLCKFAKIVARSHYFKKNQCYTFEPKRYVCDERVLRTCLTLLTILDKLCRTIGTVDKEWLNVPLRVELRA